MAEQWWQILNSRTLGYGFNNGIVQEIPALINPRIDAIDKLAKVSRTSWPKITGVRQASFGTVATEVFMNLKSPV